MQSELPKISIVTPVLNGGKTLEKNIQSILAQNYANVEHIILDGGSTDNTLDIIRKYEPHIAYWHSKPDGGALQAINAGVERASGDLVVQLMADDFYEPDTLRKVAQALIAQPDADIISCGGKIICYDTETNQYIVKSSYQNKDLDLNFQNICFAASVICCRFVRKTLYNKIGTYIVADQNGRGIYSSDKEFLLRALVAQAKNVSIDHVGHNYLAHAGSTTFSGNRKVTARMYEEHMMFAEDYLANKKLTVEQRKVLLHWHRHQSARLAFYLLATGSFGKALAVIKQNVPRYHFMWLAEFISAPFSFWLRKLKH